MCLIKGIVALASLEDSSLRSLMMTECLAQILKQLHSTLRQNTPPRALVEVLSCPPVTAPRFFGKKCKWE
jgi:hypothetical protein